MFACQTENLTVFSQCVNPDAMYIIQLHSTVIKDKKNSTKTRNINNFKHFKLFKYKIYFCDRLDSTKYEF